MIELDTRGLLCPLPVLKLQKLIRSTKQKDKIRQFELLIEIFDEDTKESIKANATFKNLNTNEKGILFKDKERHFANLNEKQKFVVSYFGYVFFKILKWTIKRFN